MRKVFNTHEPFYQQLKGKYYQIIGNLDFNKDDRLVLVKSPAGKQRVIRVANDLVKIEVLESVPAPQLTSFCSNDPSKAMRWSFFFKQIVARKFFNHSMRYANRFCAPDDLYREFQSNPDIKELVEIIDLINPMVMTSYPGSSPSLPLLVENFFPKEKTFRIQRRLQVNKRVGVFGEFIVHCNLRKDNLADSLFAKETFSFHKYYPDFKWVKFNTEVDIIIPFVENMDSNFSELAKNINIKL